MSALLFGCAQTPPAELVSFNKPPSIPDTLSGISHTEAVSVVGTTPDDLITYLINLPLEEIFEEVEGLPAVARTDLMTPDWGQVGTERRVILTDGHQAAERLLEIKTGQSFRYQVWGFTNSAGSFARYAVGEFTIEETDVGHNISWTYTFKPRTLGYVPLRIFVSTTWDEYMRICLKNIKDHIESASREASADGG